MNNWIRLHRPPKICRETKNELKRIYYYQQSKRRWLQNQDGYETEEILNKALMASKLGIVSGCCLHKS